MDTRGKDWAAADRLAHLSVGISMAGLVCAACFILYTVGAVWRLGAGVASGAGSTAPVTVVLATYWGTVALALAGLAAGMQSLRHAREGNTGATLGTLLNGVLLLALGVLFLQLF